MILWRVCVAKPRASALGLMILNCRVHEAAASEMHRSGCMVHCTTLMHPTPGTARQTKKPAALRAAGLGEAIVVSRPFIAG